MLGYYLWPTVGILLILWVVFDLFSGWTYLHRTVVRKEEPMMYWSALVIWTGFALTCFFGL